MSWHDQVLSNHSIHGCIDSKNVLDKLLCSDHLPVSSTNLVCNRCDIFRLNKLNYQCSNAAYNCSKAAFSDIRTNLRLTTDKLKLINIPQHMLSYINFLKYLSQR